MERKWNKFYKNSPPSENTRYLIYIIEKLAMYDGEYFDGYWVLHGMPPGSSQVEPRPGDYFMFAVHPPKRVETQYPKKTSTDELQIQKNVTSETLKVKLSYLKPKKPKKVSHKKKESRNAK